MSVQALVARLCRTGFLRVTGRLCYRGLAGGLGVVFRVLPQIRAAYLVGSMATDDPEPGLSDIDFVLVIMDLSWEEEYRLVQRIERILLYIMPPWGRNKVGHHVLIYAKREWLVVGDLLLGKRYGNAKTVFDKDTFRPVRVMDDWTKGLHHFYKALWRLEVLQNVLWHGRDSRLERELCARIVNRTELSIFNGVGEQMRWHDKGFGLPAREHGVPGDSRPANTGCVETSSMDALPRLLGALDEAVSVCSPPGSGQPRLEPVDGCDGDGTVDRDTTGIAALVNSVAGGVMAWVGRLPSADFVVLESVECPLATVVYRRFLEAGVRKPFIVTKTVFERLYLNAPNPAWTFTELSEGGMFVARGAYTRDRALIDAYAVFPQIRMAVSRGDRERYEATQAKLKTLWAYFNGESSQAGHETCGFHDSRHAFQKMHAVAMHLVHSLSDCLEAETPSL